jgi:hypothetical protein
MSKKEIRNAVRDSKWVIVLTETPWVASDLEGDSQEARLPEKYQDFASIFDPETSAPLLLYTGYAHPIDLEGTSVPPPSYIYPLAEKELEVL